MPCSEDERVRYWGAKLRGVIRKYSKKFGEPNGNGIRDELEQIALITIWRTYKDCEDRQLDEGGTLAFMTKQIERRMIDYLRLEFGKRYTKQSTEASMDYLELPDLSFEATLQTRQLLRKLDTMPPMMRQVVQMLSRGDNLKEACEAVSPGYPQKPTAMRDKFRALAMEYVG